jgi:hypothetical protein
MKTRHACFFVLGAAWSGGALLLACGGGGGGTSDGGPDATTSDAPNDRGISTFDNMLPDSVIGNPDGKAPDGHVPGDGGSNDGTMINDTGLVGNCSPVNGPACDIVRQNCPKGKECVLVDDPDAALGVSTACFSTTPTEHLAIGSFCCPPANENDNPCDPGMVCIGNPCIGDGGSGGGGGNCSPGCCAGLDGGMPSNNCGTNPTGYKGQCDLNIINNESQVLYSACTYSAKCITLDVAPCGNGYECVVENEAGASECLFIIGPDGGSVGVPAGGNCSMYDCAPNLGCIVLGSTGADTCLWQCYLGGITPFDAGLLDGSTGALGHGGCPSTYTCEPIEGYPNWLGACIPP